MFQGSNTVRGINHISLKKDIYPLVRLSVPLALTGFVQSAVWFFETLFLARLGTETLAAGSLVSWLMGTVAVILFGIMSSVNILVAHKYGENDQLGIALVARDGLLLSILVTIPTFLLFWHMAPLFLLFGQSATVVALASSYLHALAWGLFAEFFMFACMEVIMGLGHARIILIITVLSVLLNIVCSYVLIFGKFGFPALGIAGAGWGMTLSYWITAVFLVGYLFISKEYRYYFRFTFKFHKPKYLLELLHIGVPMGVMYCVEVAFFLALTLCMGLISIETQAANQVALQYLGLMMSMMFSIAQAITVRMGHLLGAKDIYGAEKSAYIGVGLAALLATLIAFVYWFAPGVLISADFNIHDPSKFDIIRDIEKFFVVGAVFQIFEASRIAFFGSLRGLKETKFTLLTSIITFWGIALPLGYFMAMNLKWGGVGFWWGMVAGAVLGVILLQWRFKKKMKYVLNSFAIKNR